MSSAPIRPLSIETEPATPLALSDTGGLGGHPRGLTTLFFTELWERFSYYGMRALLVLFMVKTAAEGGLGYDTKQATAVYGTYTMSVYLLSILGGFIADNFIGARRAVFVGGIIIATGHFTMALNSTATFYAGLVFVALGTGLLKPNISTMVGSLYRPDDERRDAGFSIFYLGINLGAFAAPLVTGYLAQSDHWKGVLVSWGFNPIYSWHWGFAAAGVGMVLGLVALGSLALIIAMKASDTYPVIIYALFAIQIAAILFFALRPDRDSKRWAAILVFFFAAEIFWALFEQSGSTIALFSDRLTRNEIFGWSFPSSYWQSVNSIWVVLLAPIFAFLWVHLRDRQPSSPMKFVLGLFFVALSFALMVPAAKLTAQGSIGPMWLVGLFFLQTVGEMLLSPVGLSTMTKLAPHRLVGLVMGIWFLAAALGSKLAGALAGEFKSDNPAQLADFFLHQALIVGACTLALLALVPWMKKLMGGVR